ncbi:MAG: YybH family protein [Acidobacteriota bacterium]
MKKVRGSCGVGALSRALLAASILLLAGCGGSTVSPAQPAPGSPEDRLARLEGDTGGVQKAIRAFNSAFDAKDTRRLASLFTEMAEAYSYDGRALRISEFLRDLPALWGNWSDLRTTYRIQGVKIARPYAWGKYTETITLQIGGRQVTLENLVTMAFERRGEEWLISHVHISTSTPPPS